MDRFCHGSHALARKLLELPDLDVYVVEETGLYREVIWEPVVETESSFYNDETDHIVVIKPDHADWH